MYIWYHHLSVSASHFFKPSERRLRNGGKHYTQYEATQRQRGLERSIRKKKRLAKDPLELLPGYGSAVIPDAKISGYALNMEHPVGKHKAIAFQKVLGYTVDNKDDLLRQVHQGLDRYRATARAATKYGQPFEVKMLVHGANGKYAPVKTGWQIDNGSETPRLVSIYID